MQGKVLTFSEATQSGIIAGADGLRYAFSALDVRGDAPGAFAGDEVDFQTDDRKALEVYVTTAGRQPARSSTSSETNRFVAAALAFFLGVFGAHKFYLRQNGAAVTMLLAGLLGWIFFGIPTLVVAVVALIEAVIYLTSDERRFAARYVDGSRAWF